MAQRTAGPFFLGLADWGFPLGFSVVNRPSGANQSGPKRAVGAMRRSIVSAGKSGTVPRLGEDNRFPRAVPALLRRKIQSGKSEGGSRAAALAIGIPLSLTLVKRTAIGK